MAHTLPVSRAALSPERPIQKAHEIFPLVDEMMYAGESDYVIEQHYDPWRRLHLAGAAEHMLAVQVIAAYWRLRRARMLEIDVLEAAREKLSCQKGFGATPFPIIRELSQMAKLIGTIESGFLKGLQQLMRAQQTREENSVGHKFSRVPKLKRR